MAECPNCTTALCALHQPTPSSSADLPLIAWADVPEGHDVWVRLSRDHPNARPDDKWVRKTKQYREPRPRGFEFAAAEQQPGELRAAKESRFLAEVRLSRSASDLSRLRDGLAALEQEIHGELFRCGDHPALGIDTDMAQRWADRLAALREGQ